MSFAYKFSRFGDGLYLYIKEKRENLYLLLVSRSKGLRIAQLIETSNADPTPICIYTIK